VIRFPQRWYLVGIWPRCVGNPCCNKKMVGERGGGRLELGKSPTMRNNEKSKWD